MFMYRIKDLQKDYERFSLNIIDCSLKEGYIHAVTGPNGCGKSTFLNMLSLIEQPSQGNIYFQKQRVDYSDSAKLLQQRRRIGYLMQNPHLFDMSVYTNVSYGLALRKIPKRIIQEKVDRILSLLSLSHLAGRNPRTLSTGEAQRTALARTLVLDVEVFLLDEPTASVDKNNISIVENLILSLNKEKKITVIFTTHSNNQAYRMSKNIISIIGGRIKDIAYENVFSGELEEEADGLKTVVVGGMCLKLSHGQKGHVVIAIDPQDIILSNDPFSSSALNKVRGIITKLEEVNGSLRIFIDAGVEFCALVTRRSYYDMGLNIGKKVWATFKANSVKVL